MKIVFHLGVHCTDDGRLIRSVLRSRASLGADVHVPGPRSYRTLLRETLTELAGQRASADLQQDLLDAIVESDGVERLILFQENLLAVPQRAVSEDGLYAMMPRKLAAIRNLFPDHDVCFCIALCNPAVLVPTLATRPGSPGYEAIVGDADVARLNWLGTLRRTAAEVPGLDLTLWSNEDSGLIWPEILRAVTGAAEAPPLDGDLDMAGLLLTEDGLAALRASLSQEPPPSPDARRALIAEAFADATRPEEAEFEVTLPGWSDALIDRLTNRYIADCALIAELPGIRFLGP